MTRQTSLHGWTVPTEGDADYEDTFDDFFVDLDTNGELRDVESSLNNYTPKSGAKFVATDTENRYIGDGSSWNKVQSSGKNPTLESLSTGSVTRGISAPPKEKARQSQPVSLSDLGETWVEDAEILPDGYRYPAVLHGPSTFDNPIDEWYVAASVYNDPEIGLFTASSLTTPSTYTDQGAIITASVHDHADSPSWVVDPKNNEVKLWYHEGTNGDVQETFLATTPTTGDGTNWTKYGDPTPVLPELLNGRFDEEERSYLDVRRFGDLFVGVYQGRDRAPTKSERGIGLAWSSDGIHWDSLPYPMGYGNVLDSYDPTNKNVFAPTLVDINAEPFVLFCDGSANRSTVRAISLRSYGQRDAAEGRQTLMTVANSNGVEQGDFVTVGTKTYLVYGNRIGHFEWGDY